MNIKNPLPDNCIQSIMLSMHGDLSFNEPDIQEGAIISLHGLMTGVQDASL